jgi:hypothetical protein
LPLKQHTQLVADTKSKNLFSFELNHQTHAQHTGQMEQMGSLELWMTNVKADRRDDAEYVWSTFAAWCTQTMCVRDAQALQSRMAELHRFVEPAAVALIPLIAKHGGRFKLLQATWEHTAISAAIAASSAHANEAKALKRFADAIVDVVVDFLKADQRVLRGAATSTPSTPALPVVDVSKLSLAGRCVPRTTRYMQKKHGKIAQQLLQLKGDGCYYQVAGCRTAATRLAFATAVKHKLFPEESKTRSKEFRKLLATLNKHLNTVECLMSARRWDKIQPASLPSCVKARYRQAMMFETPGGAVRSMMSTDADNNLGPEERQARLALRARFLADVAARSHQNPLNVIRCCIRTSLPFDEAAAYSAQWNAVASQVAKKFQAPAAHTAFTKQTLDQPMSLNNTVLAFDINGSDPRFQMLAGICTGLLTSQLSTGAFKNRLVTHQQTPQIYTVLQPHHQEDGEEHTSVTVLEQVQHMLGDLESERSINLPAAVKLILRTCETWALDQFKQGLFVAGQNIVPAHFLVLSNKTLGVAKKNASASK